VRKREGQPIGGRPLQALPFSSIASARASGSGTRTPIHWPSRWFGGKGKKNPPRPSDTLRSPSHPTPRPYCKTNDRLPIPLGLCCRVGGSSWGGTVEWADLTICIYISIRLAAASERDGRDGSERGEGILGGEWSVCSDRGEMIVAMTDEGCLLPRANY
jgi:hypothetical protein